MNAEITGVYAEVGGRANELTTRIIGRIRAEVPGYADLPYDEHHRDVGTGVAAILDGLRTRQPPSVEDIEYTRGMARRRARLGLPLNDSIEAYHISYREIWNELLTRAGPDLTGQLVSSVALLWTWVHRFSAAFAAAYSEEARDLAASMAALRHRLVDALERVDTAGGEEAAEALEFDPAGEFLVGCSAVRDEARVERINVALAAGPGAGHCVTGRSGAAVVVAQGMSEADLVSAVRAGEPAASVGIGAEARGLDATAAALVDATDALGAAGPGEVVSFTDEWLRVVLAGNRRRLDGVLGAGRKTAAENPQLADTVRAFAAGRYSVSAAARALHVHPNSARYRLDRWRELTGWDVHTVPGLVASLTALDAISDGGE